MAPATSMGVCRASEVVPDGAIDLQAVRLNAGGSFHQCKVFRRQQISGWCMDRIRLAGPGQRQGENDRVSVLSGLHGPIMA